MVFIFSVADKKVPFQCTCPFGFKGDRCEFPDEPCTPDPCKNGATCHNIRTQVERRFFCDCLAGFTGNSCEEQSVDDLPLGKSILGCFKLSMPPGGEFDIIISYKHFDVILTIHFLLTLRDIKFIVLLTSFCNLTEIQNVTLFVK